MPWLLIDYDPGAGGESFCAELSRSPGCVPLDFVVTENQRTKVFDRFNQGWLIPHNTPAAIDADPDLWEIIPGHRCTDRAKETLKNCKSIRIARPKNSALWDYMVYQLESKVWLAKESTLEHFQGTVNHLYNLTGNIDVLEKTSIEQDFLSLWLIAFGIDPNELNRDLYLQNFKNDNVAEPLHNFDLCIDYEDLFYNHDKVVDDIKQTFDIDLDKNWLCKYSQGFESFKLDQSKKNSV